MLRAVLLQIEPTKSKLKRLREFSSNACLELNRLLSERKSCSGFGLKELHRKTFSTSKDNTRFNVQVICSLIRQANRFKGEKAEGVTVKFNVPRNCKTFKTKSKFFVELGTYPRNRIAVPVKQNRNLQRFESLIQDGWICKTFGLTPALQIVAYLSKKKEIPERKNVLGIDVNAKCFAISVVSPNGKILYQTYLGKQIWVKRKKIMERRSLLQFFNAKRKLKRLRNRERNFVKTNLGQVVREIIEIAKRFDADIAIENLKRFKPIGRKFNKIVMRIPFAKFKSILQQRCFDNDINLNVGDSWHTSKWCSRCGAVGNGHSANYAIFKCKNCGQVVNSDRKASLAIAVKSLLERTHTVNPNEFCVQISNRRVPVSGLLRSNEIGCNNAVHLTQPFDGKPTPFMGG